MKSKKSIGYHVLAAIGLALFILGIAMVFVFEDSQGIMQTLPYISIGIGSGCLGGGIGGALSYRKTMNNPALAKQSEIDTNDERNVAIAHKAKAAAFNFMFVINSALIMFLSLMQVGLLIVLVSVGAYLLIIAIFIYFVNKYHNEM